MPKFVIDTREQRPYKLRGALRKGLKTGDYSVEGFEDDIAVERKGLGDLFNCLTGDGLKRFTDQLERLAAFRYRALIVETSWTTLSYGFLHSKLPGDIARERLLRLTMTYGVPVFFAGSRTEGKEILLHFLTNAFELLEKEHMS